MNQARQLAQFMRQWHLIDANQQDVYKLGTKVAKYLSGNWKPIWHPSTDCGDHVVVINCQDIAMEGFDWKHRQFHFNKEYPKSKVNIPAYQIHMYDPCRIVYLAVYKCLGKSNIRRSHIARLHLLPDAEVPSFLMKNVGNQLEQVQEVVKRSTEYTDEERRNFPRLVKFPEDHVVDWEAPIDNPGRHKLYNPYERKSKIQQTPTK
ncbi:hypothetical protein WR25_22349 [Diploscapter pachys]|uniref:39S ribosomal protein L13, mitochondrial n=1 Tax=Diploscapter pachys TaxID=2018661 RepID=A0A2A2LJD5_9BILA|nr:hypothetical protein WR25_22349 [Diploscapter pachys]